MEPTAVPVGVVDAAKLAGTAAAQDMSLIGLFMHADLIGKSVMVLLFIASIWCWAIILEKWARLGRLRKSADDFEDKFWSGGSLETLYERVGKRPTDPIQAIFAAGMREWKLAAEKGLLATGAMRANLQQRIERVMNVTITREMAVVEKNMTFLASIGSAAPFIGLFGTVWGIMRSFTAIAAQQNTSLAVVAPGIAEALLATAIGLFAAIPAVMAYNRFSSLINRYSERLENFAAEFTTIISRSLEENRSAA
ncbi:MAG: protein TolQ [Bdellovibrionales bacterium]